MYALNGAVTLNNTFTETPAAVPEPGSLLMIGVGLVSLILVRRWFHPTIFLTH
jgi:hypothetical protein